MKLYTQFKKVVGPCDSKLIKNSGELAFQTPLTASNPGRSPVV